MVFAVIGGAVGGIWLEAQFSNITVFKA